MGSTVIISSVLPFRDGHRFSRLTVRRILLGGWRKAPWLVFALACSALWTYLTGQAVTLISTLLSLIVAAAALWFALPAVQALLWTRPRDGRKIWTLDTDRGAALIEVHDKRWAWHLANGVADPPGRGIGTELGERITTTADRDQITLTTRARTRGIASRLDEAGFTPRSHWPLALRVRAPRRSDD